MKSRLVGQLAAVVAAVALVAPPTETQAAATLWSICRVKGQEENVLNGMGIVVGLNGTGDGGNFLPAIRSLAVAMQLMGNPIGQGGAMELKDARNVALVAVTATVPAEGARQGDRIDCIVSSVGSAKSLVGGRLFMTPLLGPVPQTEQVFALAEGPITLDDTTVPTTGKIHRGCRLEEDFFNAFHQDGKITLVLDRNHSDFQVSQDVAEIINSSQLSFQSGGASLAKALDQVNIEVTIPTQYLESPVLFVSEVLRLPLAASGAGPKVVINQRAGSIVIGGDVEIGPVVVTHQNVVVETGAGVSPDRFVPIDTSEVGAPKLKALVEALNAVHLPNEDIIEIIKQIDRNGKLYAQLIIE